MNIKTSILCCLLLFLISCEDEEENIDPIIGSWSLIQQTGGLAGIDENYAPGEIVWTFSEDSLFIEGSSMFIPEGESSYLIVEYGDSLFLNRDYRVGSPTQFFTYLEINDDAMTLNENSVLYVTDNDTTLTTLADGFFYSFERQ